MTYSRFIISAISSALRGAEWLREAGVIVEVDEG